MICDKGNDTSKFCYEFCEYRDNFVCTKTYDESIKPRKYMDAWVMLEHELMIGVEVDKEVLDILYELVKKYYEGEINE